MSLGPMQGAPNVYFAQSARALQGLTDTLKTRLRLGDDEILKALKASPLTAPHAEARAREIVGELVAADYRSSAQRAAEQLALK